MGVTSLPKITAQLLAAVSLVGAEPFRLLINGQIGSDGNAVSGQYYEVQSKSKTEIATLFGSNSDLTNRIYKAIDVCQEKFEVGVIALSAAGGGTAATLPLAYAGIATEDRTMTVKVVSGEQFSFTVDVAKDDTATEVATAVKAKIDALVSYFPAANALATSTITLTSSDVGTVQNKYTVEHSDIPAGITVNTNTGYSRDQFGSGATDPTFTGIYDNVQAKRFHSIQWPWDTAYDEPQDLLEARNDISNSFLHGLCYIGLDDTEANISTKLNGTTPVNSQNLVFIGNRKESGANVFIEPPDWRASEFCAIEGLRLTDEALISSYVNTDSPLDNIGGSALASLPLFNTPLLDTEAVEPDLLFDDTEQGNLKDDGFAIIGVNESVTNTITGEVVTTYKFKPSGDPDNSFKFVEYVRTGYLALEIFFRSLKSSYRQSRLTDGNIVPRRSMQNEGSIRSEYQRIYKVLSGADFVLTQAGAEAEKYFADNLTVTVDVQNGSVTAFGDLPIVTQLRSINMQFRLTFTVGG